jgi:hypothetical protein
MTEAKLMKLTRNMLTTAIALILNGPAAAQGEPEPRATCPATVELNGTPSAPFAGPASDARVMSAYLASEFAFDGGTIVGVSFYMVGTYTMNNLTIRLQRVTSSPRCS